MHKSNPLKEVCIFFAIVIGASYLVFWGPLALFGIPTISFVSGVTGPGWAIALFMLGGFVPSLTALLLTWIWEGVPGLKRMGKRLVQFNIGWRWYLAAVGIVLVSVLGQLVIIRLMGQSFDLSLFLAQIGSFLPLLIIGPLSEELGWRGYALDRLQVKWNPIVSALILGAVWALWHLPLFTMVGTSQHELAMPFVGFFCALLGLSVLFAWLHNHTGGSIWTAVFFHWIFTYASQVIASGVTRSPLYNWLEYAPYLAIAVVVMVVWGLKPIRMTAKAGA